MSEHRIHLEWSRDGKPFVRADYGRDHRIVFQGGQTLGASSAAGYGGNPAFADPEQQLAASASSCHMLTFLAVAANRSLVIDSYEDDAEAEIGKNAEGQMVVTTITLRPRVRFSGETVPTREDVAKLHERAHRACFISNSLRSTVNVVPRD
jgi:organic hydroperoxide reductase OsmC/OhrA